MLKVSPIPAFEDNYIWLLTTGGGTATVVDPGDADPVLERLTAEQLKLTSILVTHHHYDHIGGLDDLLAAYPEVRIYGPGDKRIKALTDRVGEGDRIQPAGLSAEMQVLEVPGHTSTHIAYCGEGALFCGDTLFAAGCGRVFDGTFEQLSASMRRIATLPAETLCYCAHEYTLANLGFAQWVEPDSAELAERTSADQAKRDEGRPTVPSPLELELATNPFMRTDRPEVIAAVQRFARHPLTTPAEVFTALQRWKDERYD